MADRTVRLILTATTAAFEAGINRGRAALKGLDAAGKQTKQSNVAAFDQLGGSALKFGALGAAAFGLAVKGAADFDKQMSAVKATGPEAAGAIDQLRAAALEAGKATAFSATEAAEGVENLLKAGVSTADVMGGGLKGALDLAAAGQLGVADAAEIAATAMTQFGLSGRDVPHIADLLAAGAGKAQGEVSDLAMALKQGGLVAAAYGLSIEETTGTLAAFASAGLIGSDAGTSFKTMLQALGNPSAKARELMEQLGIAVYDANGEFIGAAGLAGELKAELGGMSDEQRNATLATIFGSDAVRAANVLYQQGAEGIQGWIDQTNDAGYAAQVAATKTDNLAGDLERLQGSLETALIETGSGANEVLRQLAQGAEVLVNGIADLPAGALQAGLAVVGISSAALLAFGAAAKLYTGIVTLRAALVAIAPAGAGAAASLGMVGKAAGGAVAVVALAAGVEQLIKVTSPAAKSADDVTAAITALGKGSANSLDDVNALFHVKPPFLAWSKDADQLVPGVENVGDALSKLANASWWDRFTNSTDFEKLGDQIGKVDAALTGMNTADAAAAFTKLKASIDPTRVSTEQLVDSFPQYRDALTAAAKEMGVTSLSAQELADWMGGKIPPAVAAAQAAQEAQAGALGETTAATEDQTASIGDLVAAMFEQANAASAATDAQIGYEQSLDDATKAAKENGKATDLGTQKGRDNRTALLQQASAARGYIQQMATQGASTSRLTKTTATARAEFIKVARQMGYTKAEAGKLATQYGLVPKTVRTAVSAPGAVASRQQAANFKAALDRIPANKRAAIQSIFARQGYDAAMAALRNVPSSKRVVITTVNRVEYQAGKGAPKFTAAGGGQVPGWSPTPYADNVPALLTAREWVHPVAAVDYYGPRIMHALQHRQIPREALRFADGGQVPQQRPIARSYASSYSAPVSVNASIDPSGIERAVYAGLAASTFTLDGRVLDVKVDRRVAAIAGRSSRRVG